MNRTPYLPQPDPIKPFELQGRHAVEIGFGNGEFLTHIASCNPEVTYWGMEVSLTCVDKAVTRAARLGLSNVKVLLGDARFLLRHCFRDETLERIYMHFPCPWPKKRHAKRRVTAPGFADRLAATLKVGGCFEFATDEPWYAEQVAEVLGAHPALALLEQRPYQREITTKYERRWIDEGKDRVLLVFGKTQRWQAPQLVIEEGETDMHLHVTDGALDNLAQRVQGVQGGQGETHWTFREAFDSGRAWVVETVTCDEGFEQKFYLKVARRDHEALVKLDGVSHPFLTPAVRGALAHLAQLTSQGGQ